MVSVVNGEKTVFQNCEFSNNTNIQKSGSTGILRIYTSKKDHSVELNNCKFINNKGGRSGAIYNYESKNNYGAEIAINGGEFSENTGTDAGVIYNQVYNQDASKHPGNIKISGTIMKNNNSTNSSGAGGINIPYGTLSMESGAIYNNHSGTTPGDVKIGSVASRLKVYILPAKDMKDGNVNFGGYIWKSGNSEKIDTLPYLTHMEDAGKLCSVYKSKKDEVAKIGETGYETLKEAVTAAKDGDTIELIVEPVYADVPIDINKNITLNMNGYNIHNGETLSNITIASGKSLTIIGNGEIPRNQIMVKDGGKLELDGNVKLLDVMSYGDVTVKSQVDELVLKRYGGSFTVSKGAKAGTIIVTESSASDKGNSVIIEGTVDNLTLMQSGEGSKAVLNGKIGTLKLGHYLLTQHGDTATCPTTEAGPDFEVDKLEVIPLLGGPNPSREELVDPVKEVPDILVIKGPVKEDKVNLDTAVWSDPYTSDGNNIYKFLAKVTLDKDKNIVLNKKISQGIYLGGPEGSDEEGNGLRADTPVATFERAKELLNELPNPENQKIFIVGPVVIKNSGEAETWSLSKGIVQRYQTYTEELVHVEQGAALTLEDITIDGSIDSEDSYLKVTSPMIRNKGTLNIADKAILQNNHNVYRDVDKEGGAVNNEGTLNMTGGTIQNNSAVSGGGVFNSGVFNFSGGEIKDNEAKGTHKSNGISKAVGAAGGGVFIAGSITRGGGRNGEMFFTGGTISGNKAFSGTLDPNQTGIGGGISIGNGSNVYIGGTLTMESEGSQSGIIRNNSAEAEGGGIYVQQAGIYHSRHHHREPQQWGNVWRRRNLCEWRKGSKRSQRQAGTEECKGQRQPGRQFPDGRRRNCGMSQCSCENIPG